MSSGAGNTQSRGKTQVYAVVRYEPSARTPQGAVTVKEILPTIEEAEVEVARLQQLARGDAIYFWQTTRLYAGGRHIVRSRLRLVRAKDAK